MSTGFGNLQVFPVGFPKGWRLDCIAESNKQDALQHLCWFCSSVLMNAVQLKCGVRFCEECYQFIKKRPCPKCRQHEVGDAFADNGTRLKVDSFKSLCIYSPKCFVELPISELFEHIIECPFGLVKCPFGCGIVLERGQIAKHEGKCSAQKTKCTFCQTNLTQNALAAHLEVCEMTPIQCPFCAASFADSELNVHFAKQHVEETEGAVDDFAKMVATVEKKMEATWIDLRKLSHADLEVAFAEVKRQLERSGIAIAAESKIETSRSRESVDCFATDEYDAVRKLAEQVGEFESKVGQYKRLVDSTYRKFAEQESLHFELQSRCDKIRAYLQKCVGRLESQQTQMNGVHSKIQQLDQASKDGVFIWKVDSWSDKLRRAEEGQPDAQFLESPSFHTGPYGYRMRLRMFPNGEYEQRGKGISINVLILSGPFDRILRWPFQEEITISILDQADTSTPLGTHEHMDFSRRIRPNMSVDSHFAACRMPMLDCENHSTLAINRFIDHTDMADFVKSRRCSRSQQDALTQSALYLRDDTVFIRVVVQPSKQDGD